MSGISIIIFDQEQIHSSWLQEYLSGLGYITRDVVDNVGEALAAFYASEPDLVIINISKRDKTGPFEIARRISEDKINCKPIIFISDDNEDSVFETARKFKPSAYYIKPFDKYLVKYGVALAVGSVGLISKIQPDINIDKGIINSENLFIRKTKKIIKVPLSEIQYIEVESKYSTLYTSIGKFLIRISLTELMDKLPKNTFIKVHRNYIVNLNSIVEFDYNECTVHLKIGTVPMGKSFKNTISEQFMLLS